MQKLFASALAAVLTRRDGLTAAYLPEGVPLEEACAIAQAANSLRPSSVPFAVVVSAIEPDPDPGVTVIPAQQLVRYRRGDRLAVVVGRHPELSSITSSFSEGISQSFPEDDARNDGSLLLRDLSLELVALIMGHAGVLEPPAAATASAVAILESCLRQLALVEAAGGASGLVTWNARWIRHVEAGALRLARTIDWHRHHKPASSLAWIISTYTFASFGLPQPTNGTSLDGRDKVGDRVMDALTEWWGSADATARALALLEKAEGEPHALASIDWSRFDERIAASDDLLTAWDATVGAELESTLSFASLTEAQFLNPAGASAADAASIRATDVHGVSLSTQPLDDTAPFVIARTGSSSAQSSDEILIVIPTLSMPEDAVIAGSLCTIDVGTKGAEWAGELVAHEKLGLCARGRILISSTASRTPVIATRLSVEISGTDPLAGYVLPTKGAQAFLVDTSRPGLLALQLDSKRQPTRLAAALRTLDGDVPSIGELATRVTSCRLVVWAPVGAAVTLEGRSIPAVHGRPHIFIADFFAQAVTHVEVDGSVFELHHEEPATPHPSPVVSAIWKQLPSTNPLDDELLTSIRGQYEEAVLAAWDHSDEEWAAALGHVALPTTESMGFDSLSTAGGLLMPQSVIGSWKATIDFKVPDELRHGEAARALIATFEALDPFGFREEPSLPSIARWPSRIPRKDLWMIRRQQLEEYLDAYNKLIDAAREIGDPAGIFWACYPFSLSAWSFAPGAARCAAVFLSPLHPIRLAWLASAEATLWEGDDSADLAGAVSGFGLPLTGPNEFVQGGMLAVQSDTGEDQVFLGWEALLRSSTEGAAQLEAPHRIGGVEAPGTAASGLNGGAVDAALRTYRRMHPHVSTITLDLASDVPGPRVAEVDRAVVSMLGKWVKESGGSLRGGARILDSSNRTGNGPSHDVAELIRGNGGMPISWSRYKHQPDSTQRCNVRLLQDAGVRVRVATASPSETRGVIGAIPLRRFDASPTGSTTGGAIRSIPGLRKDTGWHPFTEAVRAVEETPAFESKLKGSLLVDDKADWTVSGESLLTPAAIAALLAPEPEGRMLWEWRPPIFEKGSAASIERKPYVSVARVPSSFRSQLKSKLSTAIGRDATNKEVSNLLGKLGARGVGLSSLLAMGGTHASGALGFYLGFALTDESAPAGRDRVVLPIDASDTYLRSLAGGGTHAGDRQRADLLVIDVTDEETVFIPIEIKFYGLGSESPNGILPESSSPALDEPIAQLASTTKLLDQIAKHGDQLDAEDWAGKALWYTSLAALVESGAKLSPAGLDDSTWPGRLASIAEGTSRVRVGKPVVLYFNHQAQYSDGSRFAPFVRGPGDAETSVQEVGGLIADSATAFQALAGEQPALLHDWQKVLDWAFQNRTGGGGGEGVPDARDAGEAAVDAVALNLKAEIERLESTISEGAAPPTFSPDATTSPEVDGTSAGTDGARFEVGRLLDSVGIGHAYFWPSNTELNQLNMGVVGDLGTGKTQLLKTLVYRLRLTTRATQENPLSFLILDYKEDYQGEEFLNAVGGKVLRPFHIPLNIFAIPGGYTPIAAVQRAGMFADVVAKIYGGVGPVQASNLKKAVVGAYFGPDHSPPLLSEVLDAYLSLAGKADAVSAILQDFVMAEIFSESRDRLQTFEELVDDRVLVLALNELGADTRGKNALVAFFLNLYYDYMLQSKKWPYSDGKPQLRRLNSFILIDEATNIMSHEFPVLMSLLLQGREYGFGVVLASQYLSHFKTANENYGQPLLTWFIHKVPVVTPKELTQLGIVGLPSGTENRISALNVHQALYASLGFPGRFIRGTPFYELTSGRDSGFRPSAVP